MNTQSVKNIEIFRERNGKNKDAEQKKEKNLEPLHLPGKKKSLSEPIREKYTFSSKDYGVCT